MMPMPGHGMLHGPGPEPTMRMSVPLLLLLIAGVSLAQEKPAQPAKDVRVEYGFAVYKLGEKHATDKQAGEAIDSFCKWLGDQVPGASFARRGVRNQPADALKLLQDEKSTVALAIVSPGFYAAHKDTLKLKAIAEARRNDTDGEQFTLVGPTATDAYPSGKKVATSMTADLDWLNKVVMPAPEGIKPVEWVQYDNLFDAAYAIVDGEKGAPDMVLLDRTSLADFDKDADLKGLKRGLKSELLPQDLLVEVDGRLGNKSATVVKAVGALDQTEAGKKLGETLQTPRMPAPDTARLEKALKKFKP